MTSAIVTTTQGAIEPRDMSELKAMAQAAAASKFYGASTPEAALMLLMTGRDLGLSYSQALRAFHVVQGRPVLSSAGMVAVCLRSGVCEFFRTLEASDTSATVEVKRRGDPPCTITFTIEDAKRAKLTSKDVWQAYPSRMLLARAQAFAARQVFPDLLLGLYDEDEVSPPSPPRRVEVQTVVVPEPTPTPRSAVQEPDFAAMLDACTSLEELGDIAGAMKAAKLPHEQRGALRQVYARAKQRCEAMARVVETEQVNEDSEP